MADLREDLGIIRVFLYIHFKNFEELDAFLESFKEGGKTDIFEFSRLLHNYTSSVASLIDNTRNLRKKLKSSKFDREFDQHLKPVTSSKEGEFLKKLRNYIVHFRLPPIQLHAKFSISEEEIVKNLVSAKLSNQKFKMPDPLVTRTQKYLFDTQDLLNWDGWKSCRKYLEDSGPTIDIQSVIGKYQDAIDAFYKWFYKRVEELTRD